jgi:hypothetical protein
VTQGKIGDGNAAGTRNRSGRRGARARWSRTWAFLGGVIEGANRLERRGDLAADECRSIREFIAGVALGAIRRMDSTPPNERR